MLSCIESSWRIQGFHPWPSILEESTWLGLSRPPELPRDLLAHYPLISDFRSSWSSNLRSQAYYRLKRPLQCSHQARLQNSQSLQALHRPGAISFASQAARQKYSLDFVGFLDFDSLHVDLFRPPREARSLVSWFAPRSNLTKSDMCLVSLALSMKSVIWYAESFFSNRSVTFEMNLLLGCCSWAFDPTKHYYRG